MECAGKDGIMRGRTPPTPSPPNLLQRRCDSKFFRSASISFAFTSPLRLVSQEFDGKSYLVSALRTPHEGPGPDAHKAPVRNASHEGPCGRDVRRTRVLSPRLICLYIPILLYLCVITISLLETLPVVKKNSQVVSSVILCAARFMICVDIFLWRCTGHFRVDFYLCLKLRYSVKLSFHSHATCDRFYLKSSAPDLVLESWQNSTPTASIKFTQLQPTLDKSYIEFL